MKYNTLEVSTLDPDYLGFIFFNKSERNYETGIPILPKTIKKVGVFVNESIETVVSTVQKHQLHVIQLHGEETPEWIISLKDSLAGNSLEIWKVFSIDDQFSFEVLLNYESLVDKFLFDTKGINKGGNGIAFNWNILGSYPSQKPFFLSGGIGPESVPDIKNILKSKELPLVGLDLNSKFEIAPGNKNISALKTFIDEL